MKPHFSAVADSDPFLFVSGQLPFDAHRQIPASDIGGQTKQVLDNISGILQAKGLSLDDVVKTTVWIRNASDFAGFDAAYAQAFGEHRPARSTVVCELVVSTALIEIEAIARRRTSSQQD